MNASFLIFFKFITHQDLSIHSCVECIVSKAVTNKETKGKVFAAAQITRLRAESVPSVLNQFIL
jgi:hypothetical protein